MSLLTRFSRRLNQALLRGACVVLLLAMGMAVLNMLGRPLKMPIAGSFELMGLAGAVLASFGLGVSQQRKNHIAVDIVFEKFPEPVRRVLEFVGHAACAAFFATAAWQLFRFGLRLRRTGEVSETLGLVTYPVVFCVSVGFAALTLTLLLDAWGSIGRRRESP